MLAESEQPVLLCLDEVDRLFDRPYRADFFAAVRGWHNNRALAPEWDRLHLATSSDRRTVSCGKGSRRASSATS